MDGVAFGRYRLLSLIGEGGMGRVYRAHDTALGRDVAIKVLPAELATRPGYEQRFRREAQTAAKLTEPHIIPIHDTGEFDGQLYLVMPIVDGIELGELLERDGPMSPQRAVHIVDQLAAALDAAHAAGLVHRDIKPSNALITARDFAYLIDFGIAHDSTATKLTSTGMFLGTLYYMAPERFMAGRADFRSDVYALACVLHECLTGTTPFPGDSMEQQIAGHLTLDPPTPSTQRRGIPAAFDAVIERGMAKSPDERYQSANELATAARRALTTPPSARPRAAATATATATRLADLPSAQPAATTPQPQSRVGLIAAIAIGAVVSIAIVAFITVRMSKPRTAPVAVPSPTALSTPPTYASPPPEATSSPLPTSSSEDMSEYITSIAGRQCYVTPSQVSCQSCKPGEVNYHVTCPNPAPGTAVSLDGQVSTNVSVGSSTNPQQLSDGQTLHELGWTIVSSGGWVRFTNDSTGHGLAVAGQNQDTF